MKLPISSECTIPLSGAGAAAGNSRHSRWAAAATGDTGGVTSCTFSSPTTTHVEKQVIQMTTSQQVADKPTRPRGDTVELIKVLVSEEQEILREAYKLLLASESSISLGGVADDLARAMDLMPSLNPDVLVVGFSTPHQEMAEQLRQIKQDYPSVGIVLLSSASNVESLAQILNGSSGGVAYLLKENIKAMGEVTRVIHAVAEGKTVYDPGVTERLERAAGVSSVLRRGLTRRESEILQYVAQGYRNKTIAKFLCLEVKTVEYHISNIFGKIGTNEDRERHARVHAVLTFLKDTGQLRPIHLDGLPGAHGGNGVGVAS